MTDLPISATFTRCQPDVVTGKDNTFEFEFIVIRGGERLTFRGQSNTMSVTRLPATAEDQLLARLLETGRELAALNAPPPLPGGHA